MHDVLLDKSALNVFKRFCNLKNNIKEAMNRNSSNQSPKPKSWPLSNLDLTQNQRVSSPVNAHLNIILADNPLVAKFGIQVPHHININGLSICFYCKFFYETNYFLTVVLI